MNLAHFFEAGMLVCFGFSWPLNVVKAYKAGTTKGTSLAFIMLIITGYIAGISAKIVNNQFNYVLVVYFLNLAIVLTNVLVYIRNKALDRKAEAEKVMTVRKIDVSKIEEIKENEMLGYSNSLDDIINKPVVSGESLNSVILLGGTLEKEIPVEKLAKEFDFNFDIYNKSISGLKLEQAIGYFKNDISRLQPEGVIIHIGEEDKNLFCQDSAAFDNYYLTLIDEIKAVNKKCRIALISVKNPEAKKEISLINAHIKAIAQTEKVDFVDLANAKLWNPEATKAASDFAYSMGLRIRKPLRDVAEILYSYAYNNAENVEKGSLAG